MTPAFVKALVTRGHTVFVEQNAGLDAGFPDEAFLTAGATIKESREDIFGESDMIIKVKEPQPEEYEFLKNDQILFTYLHLAASKELTVQLMKRNIKSVAYETIEMEGTLPCLQPMSEIAGRLSVQEGAKYLEKTFGGRGVLLGGVPGVPRGKVAIIGGGVVGTNTCKIAVGMGAEVTILDIAIDQGGCVETSHPTTHDDPVFVIDGVVHYCVANMPGTVALSSTIALTSTTLPYAIMIAEKGLERAAIESPALQKGINVYAGKCVYAKVADAFGFEAFDFTELAG